jgi:hypothetical protein
VGSGHSFGQLLAGMAVSGAGAATGELTGLAGYVSRQVEKNLSLD